MMTTEFNNMRRFLISVFVSNCIVANGQTLEKNFIDQNYIEVTGTAEMSVVPDLIYLKIMISERDTKNRISVTDLEKSMIAKFQEIGIDVKKDLSIDDLLSRYRSKILSKSDVILSKQYQLVVHEAVIASRVFTELEKIEISNVSVDRVDHTQIVEFRHEVKVNAIKAAREKAELLTKALGQNIGRAIYIEELNGEASTLNNIVRTPRYRSSGIEEETSPDFEKIRIKDSILVRFELK